jgi:hypothetical protein
MSGDRIEVDYRVPIDARTIVAKWSSGRTEQMGQTHVAGRGGRARIEDGSMRMASQRWTTSQQWQWTPLVDGAEAVELTFIDDRDRSHVRVFEWNGGGVRAPFIPYYIDSDVKGDSHEPITWTVRFPRAPLPKKGEVTVAVPYSLGSMTLDLIGEHGTLRLEPSTGAMIGHRLYGAPVAAVAKVAQPGEIIRARVTGFSPQPQGGPQWARFGVRGTMK